jgi:hypothetical protein
MTTNPACAAAIWSGLTGVPAAALAPCRSGTAEDQADVWTDRFGVSNPHAIAGDHLAYAVVAQYGIDGAEPDDVAQAVEEAGRYLGGPGTTAEQQQFAIGYRAAAAQYLAQYRARYAAEAAKAA